jgi:hypothetical protein
MRTPKKWDPIAEDQMNMIKDEAPDTICHVLREIYWDTESKVIRTKCRIATTMAKRMVAKLKWYKERQNSNLPL